MCALQSFVMVRAAAFVVVMVAGACYAPSVTPGAPCAPSGDCPSGLQCVANVCELPGTATIDAAPSIDGLPDSQDIQAQIGSVMVPSAVEVEGGMGTITAQVIAAPTTQVTVTFSGTLGLYNPSTRIVTTDSAGAVTTTSVFTAGITAGMETGNVTITAPAGAVPKPFMFPVQPFARYGNTTQLTQQGSFTANNLLGQTITTTTAGQLRKLGFISATAGPMIKIGIYTDSAGAPGTLIAQAPATIVAQGVNEIALTSPIALTAGTYWFLAIYDVTGAPYRDALTTRTIKYIAVPFGDALPITFPTTHSTYSGGNFNYYLVVGQ